MEQNTKITERNDKWKINKIVENRITEKLIKKIIKSRITIKNNDRK